MLWHCALYDSQICDGSKSIADVTILVCFCFFFSVCFLRIAALSPGGDAFEDGRLRVGDYLTKINGYDVVQYNTDQIHSLLLREKLRHESK